MQSDMFEVNKRSKERVEAALKQLFEEFDLDFDRKLNKLKSYFKVKNPGIAEAVNYEVS